jgi:hypothetical protein
MRAAAVLLGLAACGGEVPAVALPAASVEPAAVEIARRERSLSVRTAGGLALDLDAGDELTLDAAGPDEVAVRFELDAEAAATAPGVPVTATALARQGDREATFALRSGLLELGPDLYSGADRDLVVAALADTPLGAALRALAPYRDAALAHLPEVAPLFELVGFFQAWGGEEEPAWPRFADARDDDPPGHLDGDLVGLGMTCSSAIRCPSFAPFCVSRDHDEPHGFCTRACTDDAQCGDVAGARCSLPVIDIPDVSVPVMACAIDCASPCPGLLTCSADGSRCEPP